MQNIPQPIPFHQLTVWDGNIRRTGSSDGVESLAASIGTHGLLQPIMVKDRGDGTFAVIAGRRRFLALQQLVESGKFAEDAPVNCTIVDNSSDNTEIGLTENVMQLPMHPADKFEAFRDLADKGMAASDIAARFGIEETMVIKLLKLGRVSPEVMQAYREEKINYGQVQAFTISDDAQAQNKVLEAVVTGYGNGPRYIRSQLVQDEIPATDKRVRFIGLEFYEMCGGAVRRDLFDDENSGYIQDTDLLHQLVESKLQPTADELKAEGWKWVEIKADYTWEYSNQFRHVYPEERELSQEESEKLASLTQEYEQYDEQGFDEEDAEMVARIQELEPQIEAIENSAEEWATEDKAIAGVLVSLERDGNIKIDRGLVKPEDAAQPELAEGGGHKKSEKGKPEFSAALMRDLTSHRTAALRIELARQPHIALVSVAHALAIRVFYNRAGSNCVKISGVPKPLFRGAEEAIPSIKALDDEKNGLDVPSDISELWNWCLGRSQDELLKLLAVCAAYSIDAVDANDCPFSHDDLVHADNLASALHLDMRKWFTATADNTFNRISRKQIIQAYTEATGEPPSNAVLELKKKDLASRAGREIGDKWLPSVLRQPTPAAAE